MFFTDSLKLDLLGIFVAIIVIIIAWHKWALGYWKRKGVQGPNPDFIFGTMKDFFLRKKTMGHIFKELYDEYKGKGARYLGCYLSGQAAFVPIDLNLAKSILQTEFSHFDSHGNYFDAEGDPLSLNLFFTSGPRWRKLRVKLTPTFTTAKIRIVYEVLVECTKGLKELLNECSMQNPVDILDVMQRFTIDIIGSCVFGLEINSMKVPESEFRTHGNRVFQSIIRFAAQLFLNHKVLKAFKFTGQDPAVEDFFVKSVMSTLKYRKENNIVRKDFLNLLIELKNNTNPDERITDAEIVGQCFVFFAAGFETSSTTINFAAYELAQNRDIQDKVREEVNRVLAKHGNQVTYDAIMQMEYLDQVIQETLRKHPPLSFLWRKCTKKYTIPDESIEIDEGTNAIISTLGIHYDPEYYPNPEKFDPDRFTEDNKKTRPGYAFLPFGEGPRICIGLRFGMHQAKLGLLTLLRDYKWSLNKKTEVPIDYDPSSITLLAKSRVLLDLEKI